MLSTLSDGWKMTQVCIEGYKIFSFTKHGWYVQLSDMNFYSTCGHRKEYLLLLKNITSFHSRILVPIPGFSVLHVGGVLPSFPAAVLKREMSF